MKHVITLACCLLPAWASAQFQEVYSVQSGFWNNPAVWSTGAVPDSNSLVLISAEDTVIMPDNSARYYCQTLRVEYSGILQLRRSNFEVFDSVMVSGTMVDSSSTGVNRFWGRVYVQPAGRFDMRKNTVESRLIFENGIRCEGDSMMLGRGIFKRRNQAVEGYRRVLLYANMAIDSGLVLTNLNTDGIICERGTLFGKDDNATFVNKARIHSRVFNPPMFTGKADYSYPGNEVIYSGYQSLNVSPGPYDRLVIAGEDTIDYNAERNLTDATEAKELYIGEKSRLITRSHDLIIKGLARLEGVLYDTDSLGRMEFQDVIFGNGGFADGTGDNYGRMDIAGDLVVEGNAEIQEIRLDVQGETRIKPFYRLTLRNRPGAKYFNRVVLESGSRLYTQTSSGPNMYFRKPVVADGEFLLEGGNLYFYDSLLFEPLGTLNVKANRVNLYVYSYWRQNGSCPVGFGNYFVEGKVEGLAPIQIGGLLRIPPGKTLINLNSGGIVVSGRLEGSNESSVFENRTRLEYKPSSDLSPPMDTGLLDIRFPGNTVAFTSTARNQEIPPLVYQNITFEGGSPKYLREGDIEVKGDVTISTLVQKAPTALTLNRVILDGEGDQRIVGNGEGSFEFLEVNKPSGKLTAFDPFGVSEVLFMTRGVLDALPGELLLGSVAQLQEKADSYVRGRVASQRCISENGSNTFGNMGIRIKASPTTALGQTIVIRNTGTPYENGQIARYFEIIPTNNSNLDATVEFFYHERDLLGAPERELSMETRSGEGEFTRVKPWLRNPDTNSFELRGLATLGIITARIASLPVQVYQVPFSGSRLGIRYALLEDETVHILITDMAGRIYFEAEAAGKEGMNRYEVDLPHLGPGMYYARVAGRQRRGGSGFVRHVE